MYSLIDNSYHSKLDTLIALKSERIEKSNDPVAIELINLVKEIVNKNNNIKDTLINKKPNPNDFNELFLKTVKR